MTAEESTADEIAAIEATLQAVDVALERLEQHQYGECVVCATKIDDTLLEADPTLVTCSAHVVLR